MAAAAPAAVGIEELQLEAVIGFTGAFHFADSARAL
jgi:hypothetical protein